MRSMDDMQAEVRRRVASSPTDAAGFPRLYVCPITGVHQMVRNERQLWWARSVPWFGVVFGVALVGALVVFGP